MIKDFIPYEQALAVKELGFDEPCLAFFEINNTHQPQNLRYFLKTAVNREYIENTKILKYIYGENSLLAPLYQQAFRWFREKYKIECYVNCYWSEEDSSKRTYYANYNYGSDIFFTIKTEFSSYEEAELECLKKMIEYCKHNFKRDVV